MKRLCCIVLYCTTLHYAALQCTVLYVLNFTLMYCTALLSALLQYCKALHCTALYCNVLYYFYYGVHSVEYKLQKDCRTFRIFAYSSERGQSNKRSGTRLKTESETGERRSNSKSSGQQWNVHIYWK